MNFGLSIDPSVHATGLVTWREEDGLWKPDRPRPRTLLAANFEAMVEALDDELAFPWEWVAVEAVYAGQNHQTTIALAELQGAIRQSCWLVYGIEFYKLTTAEIDKACGTYADDRKGRKLVTRAYASRELGNEIDQHQADAYCVGVAALGERIKAGWAATAAESEE
jgi:Holliday junction resolvasome RuvABC endonuclease subunit